MAKRYFKRGFPGISSRRASKTKRNLPPVRLYIAVLMIICFQPVSCSISPLNVCCLAKRKLVIRKALFSLMLCSKASVVLLSRSLMLQCDSKKLKKMLKGSEDLNYERKCVLFSFVQRFISSTGRLALSTDSF